MKLTFLGTGTAFATNGNFHSNMVLTANNGKNLLIDAGSDIKHSLPAAGFKAEDINAVYISHLHGDHCYGLEWLGFMNYFAFNKKRIPLLVHYSLIQPLWAALNGSLGVTQDGFMTLADYFDVRPIGYDWISWQNIDFQLIRNNHIIIGKDGAFHDSFGLYFKSSNGKGVYISGDSNAFTHQLRSGRFGSNDVGFIFHDCELLPNPSRVHAHYYDLNNEEPKIKNMMWLYHYQDIPNLPDAVADGFAGFVKRGQVFDLSSPYFGREQ